MTGKNRCMIVATPVLIAIGDSEGSHYMVVAIIDKDSTSVPSVPDPDVNYDHTLLRDTHIF